MNNSSNYNIPSSPRTRITKSHKANKLGEKRASDKYRKLDFEDRKLSSQQGAKTRNKLSN
jgi:hypothetical protein